MDVCSSMHLVMHMEEPLAGCCDRSMVPSKWNPERLVCTCKHFAMCGLCSHMLLVTSEVQNPHAPEIVDNASECCPESYNTPQCES